MTPEELKKLPDYGFELDRNKIRFNGTGPRLHGNPGKIWPRDSVSPDDECRKILSPELVRLIDNEDKCEIIRNVIAQTFEGLKNVNISTLFQHLCKQDNTCFGQKMFDIHYALDCYTTTRQIAAFVNQTIISINTTRNRSNKNFHLLLFGCHKNFKIFKDHIKVMVDSNVKLRRVTVGHIVYYEGVSMDLERVSWLNGINETAKYRVFIQVIYAVARYIFELLRRYFYITVSNPYTDKLFYFRYNLWQKIHRKALKKLAHDNILEEIVIEDDSIPLVAKSKLKFYLKKDGLRLICTRPRESGNRAKYDILHTVLKFVLDKTPNYKKFNLIHLLVGLREFNTKRIEQNKPIYFVRADIRDCFQSIDQDKMQKILMSTLRSHFHNETIGVTKLCVRTRERKNSQDKFIVGKSFSIWSLDPESIKKSNKFDSVIPIANGKNPLYISLSEFKEDFLRPQLINPVLRESINSKRGYILKKGIRQGSAFSPLLCSIYIQNAFNAHLSDFLDCADCKIFCYVDDILFVSTDLEKSRKFMNTLLKGFRDYNLQINLEKLQCNFPCPKLNELVYQMKDYILFYKHRISIDTLQCSYEYFYENLELQETFRVSAYTTRETIVNSIKKSKIECIIYDEQLNGYDQATANIFERLLLIAHRAGTMILVSLPLRNLDLQTADFIHKLIVLVARRLHNSINNKVKRRIVTNSLTFEDIRLLTAAAFRITWKRNKLRHRVVELDRIESDYRRYMMRLQVHPKSVYAVVPNNNQVDFLDKLNEMQKNFPKTSFAREVILPSK